MKFLYNFIYLLLLLVGSPWLIWRIVIQRKNRNGWDQKLLGLVPKRSDDKICIWIHAVSVGEVNLLPNLVAKLKEEYVDLAIAISTTTHTGWQLAKSKFPDDQIFFCPSDFSWAVNNALDRIRPDMLVLTELELWPNLISIATNRNIPVVLINGRIGEQSYRGYRRIRFLMAPFLSRLSVACVQTDEYRDRLIRLGMPGERVTVTGNMKFDNAFSGKSTAETKSRIECLANFAAEDFVFVAGSTLEIEDFMLVDIFDTLRIRHPELRLILVPRHPERIRQVENYIRQRNLSYTLRSKLSLDNVRNLQDSILIVDVIGELGTWWELASAGFVGGSMGQRGGQNMIEPAAYGIPISFGPDTRNFKDVVQLLLAKQGACRVQNQNELYKFVEWSISERVKAKLMGQRARELAMTQRGALNQTVLSLAGVLLESCQQSRSADSRNAA